MKPKEEDTLEGERKRRKRRKGREGERNSEEKRKQ